jgi:RimJ/RimL family protein N-acetyltransferase
MLEVGWALARPAWGKGYATEVGRAALDVAFAQGAQKVCSVILPANERSIRVALRLGEKLERSVTVGGFDCSLYVADRSRR